MLNSTELKTTIIKECKVSLWLFKKTDPKHFSYCPTEDMWSLEELLKTLSFIGIYTAEALRYNDFKSKSHERYYRMKSRAFSINLENEFESEMNYQIDLLNAFFDSLNPEQYAQEAWHPLIDRKPLHEALIEVTLKFINTYKSQLFFYNKLLGNDLKGADLFAGRDQPFYKYE